MAAYRRVYDSRHAQAECQEPGSARSPTLGNRVWATFIFYYLRPNQPPRGTGINYRPKGGDALRPRSEGMYGLFHLPIYVVGGN